MNSSNTLNIPEDKFPLPKTLLTEKEDAESFISYYIAPRYKLITASLQMLQYTAGAIHMLDMMCVPDSEAEKVVREVKQAIGELINSQIKYSSQLYVTVLAEHNAIKSGVNPYVKTQDEEE